MIDVFERAKLLLNKDKARLPNGFLQCLTAEIAKVLGGYMDIKQNDINISLEYLDGGRYALDFHAVGEKLNGIKQINKNSCL